VRRCRQRLALQHKMPELGDEWIAQDKDAFTADDDRGGDS
jgi:hypothetical protein